MSMLIELKHRGRRSLLLLLLLRHKISDLQI
jgi:hypothetical protein